MKIIRENNQVYSCITVTDGWTERYTSQFLKLTSRKFHKSFMSDTMLIELQNKAFMIEGSLAEKAV